MHSRPHLRIATGESWKRWKQTSWMGANCAWPNTATSIVTTVTLADGSAIPTIDNPCGYHHVFEDEVWLDWWSFETLQRWQRLPPPPIRPCHGCEAQHPWWMHVCPRPVHPTDPSELSALWAMDFADSGWWCRHMRMYLYCVSPIYFALKICSVIVWLLPGGHLAQHPNKQQGSDWSETTCAQPHGPSSDSCQWPPAESHASRHVVMWGLFQYVYSKTPIFLP